MLKSSLNIFSAARERNRPLILDGAMGSLLQQMGVESRNIIWTALANIKNGELVKNIHTDYILAGADIITTNTFRTNPASLVDNEYNLTSEEMVRTSLSLAIQARKNYPVYIAASNAPAEDCYQTVRNLSTEQLRLNHEKHIYLLTNNACDFVLCETQSHMDEIGIICRYCYATNTPYVISLYFTEELKILSGEEVLDVVEFVKQFNPLAIGFNCITARVFKRLTEVLVMDFNWGFYFNCGAGNVTDEVISCGIDPESYWKSVKGFLYLRPSFIGACCGSDPNHIKYLREKLNGISGN